MNISRRKNIKVIKKATGWTKEKIISELEEANKIGMKSFRYRINEAWKLNKKELTELNNEIEKTLKKEKYKLSYIKSETKLLKEVIIAKKIKANKAGISDNEFYDNKLYSLNNKKFIKYLNENCK